MRCHDVLCWSSLRKILLHVYCWFSHYCFIIRFPFAHLPPLSQGTNVGRSNIRKVAERRQADLQQFLNVLFEYHPEVAGVSNFLLNMPLVVIRSKLIKEFRTVFVMAEKTTWIKCAASMPTFLHNAINWDFIQSDLVYSFFHMIFRDSAPEESNQFLPSAKGYIFPFFY